MNSFENKSRRHTSHRIGDTLNNTFQLQMMSGVLRAFVCMRKSKEENELLMQLVQLHINGMTKASTSNTVILKWILNSQHLDQIIMCNQTIKMDRNIKMSNSYLTVNESYGLCKRYLAS